MHHRKKSSGGCFSADSTAQVLGKGVVAMKDLAVGDQVLMDAHSNKYEPVYAFGHWNPTASSEFVRIQFSKSGCIEVTEEHLVKVNGSFIKAFETKYS